MSGSRKLDEKRIESLRSALSRISWWEGPTKVPHGPEFDDAHFFCDDSCPARIAAEALNSDDVRVAKAMAPR